VSPRASIRPSGSPCPFTFASISSYSSTRANDAGSLFSAVDDAVDPLQGALLALAVKPALDLAEQRRRLPEQFDQARLELVGQKLLRRTDIDDRHRPVIEPLADDVEESLGLAGLRRGRQHDATILRVRKLPLELDHVRR
jgi:hypothetical protein